MSNGNAPETRIMVYTKGVDHEGGGGRLVASELLHHFNRIADEAVSWSILPLDPTRLYGGRYRYRAVHALDGSELAAGAVPDLDDPALRRRLADHLTAALAEVEPIFLLFDTEYSLLEFAQWSEGCVDPTRLPPLGALVHDQLWKWDPAVLPLGSGAADAPALARACPLPAICGHVVLALRRLREARARMPRPDAETVLDDLARLDAAPADLCPSDPARLDRCRRIKKAIHGLDRVFCLTPRSARETRAACNLAPENAAWAAAAPEVGEAIPGADVRTAFDLGSKRGVLCFSRMSREKNLELALTAFALARRLAPERLRDAVLWMAGQCLPEQKPYLAELRDLADLLGVAEHVRFLGTVDDAAMRGLYDAASVFVCTQAADWNMSTMQALSRGCPVVVFAGYDFPPGLENAPGVRATARTTAELARDLVETLTASDGDDRPAPLDAVGRRTLAGLTFFNYAQTVIRAFRDPFHRANPKMDAPGLPELPLVGRAGERRADELAQAEALLDAGRHDQALSRLNRLEWAAGPESAPPELLARVDAARRTAGRPSLFPTDIRPVPHRGPDMEAFRNRHAGERCFILGNGPSLKRLDLSRLKGEITFGVNGLFHIFGEMGFKPTYYVVEDTFVAEDNAAAINALTGMQRFFGRYLQYCLDDAPDVTWTNVVFDYGNYPDFPHFGPDATQRLWVGGTVSYLNLQLAYFMGFREAYLVGFDHSYRIPTDARVEGTCITSASDDPNHVHPAYFGKGKRWHDPALWRMELAYRRARQVFEADGRIVANASAGGRLEVFPRVDYRTLFPDAPSA